MDYRIAPDKIEKLGPNEIFCFGSNEGGKHGRGAAKTALKKFGAIWGQAEGLQGRSYGIPTKDAAIRRILTISEIKVYVDRFIIFAKENPHLIFMMTEVGCGLSKYKPKDIAPLFEECISLKNVYLPRRFHRRIDQPKVNELI